MQMLRVFFPEASELERRQLAVAVPPSVSPCTGLYDGLEIEALLEKVFSKHLPPKVDSYQKPMWESVRQLVGALGLGDHVGDEKRNQIFDHLDVDGNGKVRSWRMNTPGADHTTRGQGLPLCFYVCRLTSRTSFCGISTCWTSMKACMQLVGRCDSPACTCMQPAQSLATVWVSCVLMFVWKAALKMRQRPAKQAAAAPRAHACACISDNLRERRAL
jgi:hypothetical protein